MKTLKSSVGFPASELLMLLARALNTLEPKDTPKWATALTDELQPTDEVTLTFERKVEDDWTPSPSRPGLFYRMGGVADLMAGATVETKNDPAVNG